MNYRRVWQRSRTVPRRSHRRVHGWFEPLEDRQMCAVDWRNPVDALDVNGDRFIVPLDVLPIINDLNANGPRRLPGVRPAGQPYLDVNGDLNVAPLDVLQVVNAINAGITGPRQLEEGTQLASEAAVTITLGQSAGTREYRVAIETDFDTTSAAAATEDVLAVYLIDPQQPSQTLLDRGQPGTALFTLAGTQVEFAPGKHCSTGGNPERLFLRWRVRRSSSRPELSAGMAQC